MCRTSCCSGPHPTRGPLLRPLSPSGLIDPGAGIKGGSPNELKSQCSGRVLVRGGHASTTSSNFTRGDTATPSGLRSASVSRERGRGASLPPTWRPSSISFFRVYAILPTHGGFLLCGSARRTRWNDVSRFCLTCLCVFVFVSNLTFPPCSLSLTRIPLVDFFEPARKSTRPGFFSNRE